MRITTPVIARLALGIAAFIILSTRCGATEEPGLLLHLSFDGSLKADVAKGDPEGRIKKDQTTADDQISFVEGVQGKGLLLGQNALGYSVKNVFPVKQGTIMFWAKPVAWDPGKTSKNWTYFFTAQQAGGAGDMLAFWRYPDTMQGGCYNFYIFQANTPVGVNNSCMVFDIKDWKQGEWRFFALTWDKDAVTEIYENGKRTQRVERWEIKQKNAMPANIEDLFFGGGTVFDEFRLFSSVLSEKEIQRYFVQARSPSLPGVAAASPAVAAVPAQTTSAAVSGQTTDFPNGPATVAASLLSEPIKLDGNLGDPGWKRCVEVRDMRALVGDALPSSRTSFRVGYTRENLYIAVECGSRAVKPRALVLDHDGPVFTDDSIEIFLAPEAGKDDYYQLAVNCLGVRYESHRTDKTWDGDWSAVAKQGDGVWRLEIAIPWHTLGVEPASGKVLGLNLCRNDISGGREYQTWSLLPMGGYHQPLRFGHLRLSDKAVGIEDLGLKRTQDGVAILEGSLYNAMTHPVKVEARMFLRSPAGTFTPRHAIELGANKTETLSLKVPGALKEPGDVSLALAVTEGTNLLYLSSGRQFPREAVPLLSGGAAKAVLENSVVRYEFDSTSGALLSILHKATGTELRPRKEAAPVFALDAVSFKTNPLFFSEDEVQVLAPDASTCRECIVEGKTLRQRHVFSSVGVEVTFSVELPENTALARWNIKVDNRPFARPSRGVVVHRVAFPLLKGLRPDENGSRTFLAIPQRYGLLVPNPATNLSKMLYDYQNGRYSPGFPSMSWLDLSGSRAGVYVASCETEVMHDTIPEAANDEANNEMEVTIRRWSLLWPNETWKPGPCMVGVHAGDWHWAADRYHEWFYSSFKPRPLPGWLRECNGWVDAGGGRNVYTWDDVVEGIRRGKPFGMAYAQKWCPMVGGDLGYAAFPFPNPYAGTFEEFKGAVKRIHDMGGRLGFYHNLMTGDPTLGQFVRQPRYRQKIPDDVPLPPENPFVGGWLESCRISPSGELCAGGDDASYLDGYWWNCFGAKTWMDFNYEWMANRWRKEYKLDACYLDSAGPITHTCFNLNHGHPRPHGQMQFLLDFYKRLAKGTDPEYGILQEFPWDRLMIHGTHSLASFGISEFAEPALFRYTHPDYPVFAGTGDFFGCDIQPLLGIARKPTWPEVLGCVYLYGARFDTFGFTDLSLENLSPEDREQRDVYRLRQAVGKELNSGEFRDRIGLAALPPLVHSRVFVHRKSDTVLLTLLDLRDKREAFPVSLDLSAHGFNTVGRVELVRDGGKTEPLPAPVMSGTVATIGVPADAGKTAAVRMMVAR